MQVVYIPAGLNQLVCGFLIVGLLPVSTRLCRRGTCSARCNVGLSVQLQTALQPPNAVMSKAQLDNGLPSALQYDGAKKEAAEAIDTA